MSYPNGDESLLFSSMCECGDDVFPDSFSSVQFVKFKPGDEEQVLEIGVSSSSGINLLVILKPDSVKKLISVLQSSFS